MPKVTVVIPTYNRAALVRRAIDSALAQTMDDGEIIVVDDGSTDDTPAVLASYGGAIERMRIRNGGPGAARNAAISRAAGKYVAFLDSDDVWHPEMLEAQMSAMERFGGTSGACFTDGRPMTGGRSFFEDRNFAPEAEVSLVEDTLELVMLARQPVLLPGLMASTELIRDIGGFDPRLRVGQDTDLIFRVGFRTKFTCVNRVLAFYDASQTRVVSQTMAVKRDPCLRCRCEARMYEKLAETPARLPEQVRRELRRRFAVALETLAGHCIRSGDPAQGRLYMGRAVVARPSARCMAKLAVAYAAPWVFNAVRRQPCEAGVGQHMEAERAAGG